jgi:short-subunit dehydrogenase
VNTLGALAVLHAALGPMAARGSGTLSAVSSLAGRRGLPASAAYSASKAALSIFLEALRIELSASSVRVVDIRPGFVDTPMTRKNNFRMPFMLDVEDAAARAIRGLERGEAVVSFPWQASAAMGFAAHMPAALWRGVAAHLPVTSGSDSGKRPH